MANTETKISGVSFYVFRKDGSRNPDIKYSFLEKQVLTLDNVQDQFLSLDDATKWKLILESEVSKAFATSKAVKCILSFQARVDGNFVVARLFNPDHKPHGRKT